MTRKDLVGRRFGRLVVTGPAPNRRRGSGRSDVFWACVCECGVKLELRSNSLLTRNTASCGCLQKELAANRCRLGAKAKPPTSPKPPLKQRLGRRDWRGQLRSANYLAYVSWSQMRQRCLDRGCHGYTRYGGAGIGVCERWVSFEAFLSDMGPRPSRSFSLDRIDNLRGYEPGNCRWATHQTQSRNKRGLRWFNFRGRPALLGDVCEALGIKYSTADMRLRRGLSIAEAFGTTEVSALSADDISRLDMSEALRIKEPNRSGCAQ